MNLPTIPRAIDNTAMSSYMHCPREFKLAMLEGWRPKAKSQALSFGALWHVLLEHHYKTGGNEMEVIKAFTEQQHSVPDEGDYRTSARALVDYRRYRKEYNIEKDCADTIGFPDNPMVELSTAVTSDILGHEYAVKIDRLIIQQGLGYVEDHKTTSRFDKGYFKQYELSNQMMGYVRTAQRIVPGVKFVGVRVNLMHILTAQTKFYRHIVTYSESQLNEWERNAAMWTRRMERSVAENDFPAHFGDDGCSRRFGRCQFFDVCGSSPSIRDEILKQNFEIEMWDPLKSNEGGAE